MVDFFFFFSNILIQVDQRYESSKKMTSVLCQDITIKTLIRLNKILSTVKIWKSRREALHSLQSLQIQSLHKDLG